MPITKASYFTPSYELAVYSSTNEQSYPEFVTDMIRGSWEVRERLENVDRCYAAANTSNALKVTCHNELAVAEEQLAQAAAASGGDTKNIEELEQKVQFTKLEYASAEENLAENLRNLQAACDDAVVGVQSLLRDSPYGKFSISLFQREGSSFAQS